MLIGIVEFTSEEPVPSGSLDGEVMWRSTSRDVRKALTEGPVEAIVFHVQLDESNDLVRTLYEVKQWKPEVKMVLAGSSNNLLVSFKSTQTFLDRLS